MKIIKNIYRFLSSKHQTFHLDYPVDLKPLWKPSVNSKSGDIGTPHSELFEIIAAKNSEYSKLLEKFTAYFPSLQQITPHSANKESLAPNWLNGFLPGLDLAVLYSLVAEFKPARYIEIGSGNSTRVVRKAIDDHSLRTEIVSIDPHPRAEIDALAHRIVRKPFEDSNEHQQIVDALHAGDILFIDNSHRVLPNSDALHVFMHLLPRLRSGVLVQIHDVYLPYDYPQFMCDRYYNEQYMLAAMVLSNPQRYEPLLPNFYISEMPDLAKIAEPLWQHPNTRDCEHHGGSFWLRIN